MKDVERFLKQATRGLWGKKRWDARLELRGAIEDKVYRYTLIGLTEQDAVKAALRDLGNPNEIARELGAIHTLPNALKFLMLAGLTGILSLQAAAQMPTVRAVPDPTWLGGCTFDEAALSKLSPEEAANIRRQLAAPSGLAQLQTKCRHDNQIYAKNLLLVSDFIAALKAGGIKVTSPKGAENTLTYTLTFPNEPKAQARPTITTGEKTNTLDLSCCTTKINGQMYVWKSNLITELVLHVSAPLTLTGFENPTLQVGPAKLQLGTEKTPVVVTDMYTFNTAVLLMSRLAAAGSAGARGYWKLEGLEPEPARLKVNAPDQTLFVTLSNEDLLGAENCCSALSKVYLARIRAVKAGAFSAPQWDKAKLVNTEAELIQATQRKEPAFLVYKLDTADLRNLKLTPVPAAQIKVIAP